MARHSFPARLLFLVFAVIVLIAPAPAFAQITPQGVEKLQSLFADIIARYASAAKSSGAELITEGDILVEPGDFYYAVTLPHVSVKQKDGSTTEIGMISANVIPGEKPDQWKMTVALPTPLTHRNPEGTITLIAGIGSQNFAGIWHEKFGTFIKINAQYKDIAIDQPLEQTRAAIPSASLTYDLTENAEGRWSGPADFKMSDFRMMFDKDKSEAHIGSLSVTSAIKDYALDSAQNYQAQIEALTESYEAGDAPSDSTAHLLGVYNMVFDFLGKAWDGFGFSMTMTDFSLTRPPSPGTPEGRIIISNAGFGFDMDGFRSGIVRMGLAVNYDGFLMTPTTPDYNPATPGHVEARLNIGNLPYAEMVDLGRGALQGTLQNPQAGKLAGLQAMMMLPQILTTAQTTATLNTMTFGNAQYDVLANGAMTANLKAVSGATGKARAEVSGMERLTELLKTSAENPGVDAAQKKTMQDTLATLAVVQMIGQMEKNSAGKDVRVYNFELNEQGQALLNGTDMQMLFNSVKGSQD